jgi:hypothetical protein
MFSCITLLFTQNTFLACRKCIKKQYIGRSTTHTTCETVVACHHKYRISPSMASLFFFQIHLHRKEESPYFLVPKNKCEDYREF